MLREIRERLQVDQPVLARLKAADVVPGRIVHVGSVGSEGDEVRVSTATGSVSLDADTARSIVVSGRRQLVQKANASS
jgi:hypothetical protein